MDKAPTPVTPTGSLAESGKWIDIFPRDATRSIGGGSRGHLNNNHRLQPETFFYYCLCKICKLTINSASWGLGGQVCCCIAVLLKRLESLILHCTWPASKRQSHSTRLPVSSSDFPGGSFSNTCSCPEVVVDHPYLDSLALSISFFVGMATI